MQRSIKLESFDTELLRRLITLLTIGQILTIAICLEPGILRFFNGLNQHEHAPYIFTGTYNCFS